ncbi:hypothetical protein K435DRAFT_507102 [Dendrothele bispora CBS 962.96]|uniref:Uncharacterized protein n=1 Tax=Dendrothele bispora (strain CBS 962.96) TaxID=1314807 RepID=A0A4V4HIE7_DENBC|nr:hypothetical protein K435DRAFT_507102 [Dendrothele bispora CBS 962.96]
MSNSDSFHNVYSDSRSEFNPFSSLFGGYDFKSEVGRATNTNSFSQDTSFLNAPTFDPTNQAPVAGYRYFYPHTANHQGSMLSNKQQPSQDATNFQSASQFSNSTNSTQPYSTGDLTSSNIPPYFNHGHNDFTNYNSSLFGSTSHNFTNTNGSGVVPGWPQTDVSRMYSANPSETSATRGHLFDLSNQQFYGPQFSRSIGAQSRNRCVIIIFFLLSPFKHRTANL